MWDKTDLISEHIFLRVVLRLIQMKCVNFTSLELSSYSLNGRVLAAFPKKKTC